MYRLDPLDEGGKFDLDFFSSPEYKKEGQLLVDYLIDEGFEEDGNYVIKFKGRTWEVVIKKH